MSACQYVREQVMELSAEERDRTVIVVPDASSLPVLLQALPSQKDGYNVTMGMSLKLYLFILKPAAQNCGQSADELEA